MSDGLHHRRELPRILAEVGLVGEFLVDDPSNGLWIDAERHD
jgi:hypothetical protein